MNYDQTDFEIVDLGVASEETLGGGHAGPETGGHPLPAGISDLD